MIKRDILVNHLKTSFSEKEYSVELNTLSDFSFFVKYSRLVVLFEIDFSQLSTIVDASKPPQISEEIIKYGDYIRTTTSFKKKVDIQNIVIAIFVLIVISVLWFFGYRIGGKHDDESLESKKEKLSSNKKKLEEIKETLSEDGVEPELVERISGLLEKVEEQLEAYEDENIVKSILFEEVVKAETRSNELYNRSTLMLILGLVTATVGVVVFYITLPNYIDQAPSQYLPSTIRPSLILLFIQSIAFYLLRQYRSLILDYKHFYQEYTKTARIFSVYQILQRENPSDEMKRFAETVLQGVELQQLGNSKKENESKDNQIVVETLKSLVSKLKV